MVRGILVAVLVVAVFVGGYLFYKQHYTTGDLGSGDVIARKAPADSSDSSNASTTDLDGTSNGALPTPSRSDAPGTVNGEPVSGSATSAGAGNQLTQSKPASATGTMHAPESIVTPPSLPVADTVAPNPPNGAVFSGTGAFQWYRQGNITWRVDSKSGRSCIAFATMDEWQKQIVLSNGCGRFS